MAKPVINIGAYGDRRSSAAAEGVKEAITGVEADLDKAEIRKKAKKDELDKIQKAEAKQEDENWEATQISDDPSDVLQGNLEEGLREMKTELGGLDLKTTEGRARKREIYKAYADVNKGIGSVGTLLKEYREALGPNGKGIDDSTPVRVRKILMALDKDPGAFELVYENGMMRIKGEADGETVDEPMGAYLSNLRFSPKTNWDTTFNKAIGQMKGKTTSVTRPDGSTYDVTKYDQTQKDGFVNELLGGPRHKLLSLAANFGITPEDIAEQNLTDDDLKEQLRPLLDAKLTREDTSIQTKAAVSTEVKVKAEDANYYNEATASVKGIQLSNVSDFAGINAEKLGYNQVLDADGKPTGNFTLTQFDGKDDLGSQEFTPDAAGLASAKQFATKALLGREGALHQKQQQVRATAQRTTGRREFKKVYEAEKDNPKVQTGAGAPPLGKTPAEKAIRQLWEDNNFDAADRDAIQREVKKLKNNDPRVKKGATEPKPTNNKVKDAALLQLWNLNNK